jgi:hypothetical protein
VVRSSVEADYFVGCGDVGARPSLNSDGLAEGDLRRAVLDPNSGVAAGAWVSAERV